MADNDLLVIDTGSEFGARVARHLRADPVAWLTTVSAVGAPVPSPVWFLWDGAATVRVFSLPATSRARNLAANPRVTLNFDGGARGDDIVVLSGTAAVEPGEPDPQFLAAYLDKYADLIADLGTTPEGFRQRYSLLLAITLTRLRGH